jgi:plastocyanin domain-containing protein
MYHSFYPIFTISLSLLITPAADAPTPPALAPSLQPLRNLNQPVPASVEATVTPEGIQAALIVVEKGYQPKRVIVEAGQPVRLYFDRKNLSECYDQLLIPAFGIEVDLTPNQITIVEFTPQQPGEYEFMCGMKMNRGVIEVRPSQQPVENVQPQNHIHT